MRSTEGTILGSRAQHIQLVQRRVPSVIRELVFKETLAFKVVFAIRDGFIAASVDRHKHEQRYKFKQAHLDDLSAPGQETFE